MKPDWKDAPEWANWLAMDADGRWFWHECEPKWFDSAGAWLKEGNALSKHLFASVRRQPSISLEGRPQTTEPASAGSEGQGAGYGQ